MKPKATLLRARRLCRRLSDEAGQALVFGALTLFMLAAFIMFTADSGMISSTRIEMQNAADECAYAGVLYEANIISDIAYLNEAMAWMYYDALRYAVDTTITGTLDSLKLYRTYPPFNYKPPDDSIVHDDKDADAASLNGNPQSDYDTAYQTAKENIPKIETTLNMFARWEWGMALACGEVVDMEMNRVALAHNVEAMAIYPDVRLNQRNAYQLDLHIVREKTGTDTTGWKIWTDDTRPPFYLEATKVGPGHWRIEDSNHDVYDIETVSPTVHHITVNTSKLNEDITVNQVAPDDYVFDMIETNNGKATTTHVEAKNLPGLGWAVSADDGTSSVKYLPFAQGGYMISVVNRKTGTSGSAGVRTGPNGHLQQWTGSDWVDVPGQADSVNVGGVQVQVTIDNKIDLDPYGDHMPTFTVPSHLQINPDVSYDIPDVLNLPNITVVIASDGVQIEASVGTPAGTLRFLVNETNMDRLTLYSLVDGHAYIVPDSADAKWHPNADGTERDRLCPGYQTGNDFDPARFSDNEWTYQYRRGNPFFIKEVMERFAHHAICDRDDYWKSHNEYPRWAYSARYTSDPEAWYDVANGRPLSGKYTQTRAPWPGTQPNYDSDGDGKPDAVRITALEGADGTYGLSQDNTRTMDRFGPYYVSVSPWSAQGHDAAQQLVDLPGPIRLSEDFFYYAMTVACWRSAKQNMASPVSLFRNPSWGVVAAASARAGFLETHDRFNDPAGCDPQAGAPHWRFTWGLTNQIQTFVDCGYEDLYEPIWTAHLWPMSDAIKDTALLAYIPNQTGLWYLFTGLLHANWFEPRPPNLMGQDPKRRDDVPGFLARMGINPDDPRLGNVLHH